MSNKINQLISCKGIVIRISMVRPKLTQSVHYCQTTQNPTIKQYYDEFNLAEDKNIGLPKGYPLKDMNGNPLETEFGYCSYKDFQTIVLQEMPERLLRQDVISEVLSSVHVRRAYCDCCGRCLEIA